MNTEHLGVDLQQYLIVSPSPDPRGGRTLDFTADSPALNNLHVQYRGQAVGFAMPNYDPQGVEMRQMDGLPYRDHDALMDVSLRKMLVGIKAKQDGLGGQVSQVYYEGISMGVTL